MGQSEDNSEPPHLKVILEALFGCALGWMFDTFAEMIFETRPPLWLSISIVVTFMAYPFIANMLKQQTLRGFTLGNNRKESRFAMIRFMDFMRNRGGVPFSLFAVSIVAIVALVAMSIVVVVAVNSSTSSADTVPVQPPGNSETPPASDATPTKPTGDSPSQSLGTPLYIIAQENSNKGPFNRDAVDITLSMAGKVFASGVMPAVVLCNSTDVEYKIPPGKYTRFTAIVGQPRDGGLQPVPDRYNVAFKVELLTESGIHPGSKLLTVSPDANQKIDIAIPKEVDAIQFTKQGISASGQKCNIPNSTGRGKPGVFVGLAEAMFW